MQEEHVTQGRFRIPKNNDAIAHLESYERNPDPNDAIPTHSGLMSSG